MARSDVFARFARALRMAKYCDAQGLPTREGVERFAAVERVERESRRRFLTQVGGAAALTVAGGLLLPRQARAVQAAKSGQEIAIIGGGLAGLACGYELAARGVWPTIYEAADRVGGRCYSLAGVFPGQVVELGGELIDTGHKTMLGYANAFGLQIEDITKGFGEQYWYIDGALRDDTEIVEEFRAFVPRMQEDLRSLTGGLNADMPATAADIALDYMDMRTYLATRGAGPILTDAIDAAYGPEYGREIDEQSSLNLLFFIHADRRSKFHEFGVFSDERYHVVGGNGQISDRMAEALGSSIALGHALIDLWRRANGRYVMTFDTPSGTVEREADAVVLAAPFSTLRHVSMDDASLGLPPWKRYAIDHLQYGTNAKVMVGMNRRTWLDHGGNGRANCLLPNAQNVWETNPGYAGPTAVLTDFSGGLRGASLDPNNVQAAAEAFLADVDQHVFPGVLADATRLPNGDLRAVMQHWPTEPWQRGSYTCNQPGYFTTIADNEGKRVGNLFFAGEHADSFYNWQGFMEGAAASGVAVATEILHELRQQGGDL
ncbi:MAG: twin-arginine translocation signal domain-containing protein [Deltaproteobacteria bacterium]|nr:MAG: twin-arginine translocation signal domain-containing protein [Deltaproteobacteria bacterium]